MAASGSAARAAAKRSSAFATPTTKPTTAPAARPAERSWLTAVSPGSSAPTGRAHSKSWKFSSAAEDQGPPILLDSAFPAAAQSTARLLSGRRSFPFPCASGPSEPDFCPLWRFLDAPSSLASVQLLGRAGRGSDSMDSGRALVLPALCQAMDGLDRPYQGRKTQGRRRRYVHLLFRRARLAIRAGARGGLVQRGHIWPGSIYRRPLLVGLHRRASPFRNNVREAPLQALRHQLRLLASGSRHLWSSAGRLALKTGQGPVHGVMTVTLVA